jgi:hypothetical protein
LRHSCDAAIQYVEEATHQDEEPGQSHVVLVVRQPCAQRRDEAERGQQIRMHSVPRQYPDQRLDDSVNAASQ